MSGQINAFEMAQKQFDRRGHDFDRGDEVTGLHCDGVYVCGHPGYFALFRNWLTCRQRMSQ